MHTCRRDRRRKALGVATVISTVMMTMLTLTLGIVSFFWASQTFGIQLGSAGIYFKNSSDSLLEGVVIEDVWFNDTNKVWITVRNVGTIDVRIVAIYVNSTSQTNTLPAISPNGISVAVGRAVAIKVTTGFTWSSQKFVYVSVATGRGTVVRGYWGTGN
jgi:hypothetical protein